MGTSRQPSRRIAVVGLLTSLLFVTSALAGCAHETLLNDPGVQGRWGPEFLSSDEYGSLMVEIDHEPDAAPSQKTLASLQSTIGKYLNKPNGVEFRTAADLPDQSTGRKYSFDEIRSLEEDVRNHRKGGDTAVIYIMFLDGGSTKDSNEGRVLGAAYSGSSIVMFKDNIRKVRENCASILALGCPSTETIEEAVMIHELGHILGLVNNGIPMQTNHEDPEHPGHSSNSRSVMYWKVESGNIIDFIRNGNSIPNTFDSNDEADMRAAGGK